MWSGRITTLSLFLTLCFLVQNHKAAAFSSIQGSIRRAATRKATGGGSDGPSRRKTTCLDMSMEDPWSELTDKLTISVSDGTETLVKDVEQIVKDASEIQWTQLLTPGPGVVQVKSVVSSILATYLSLPLYAEIGLVVLPTALLLGTVLYILSFPSDDFREGYEPYPRGDYDPIQARVYYSKHPLLVIQRTLQLLRISNNYIFNYLLDKFVFRDEERQRSKRAQELLTLINKAGPTAIKVGQALSVRADLIPQEFAETLATLQDRVPPFSGDQARKIVSEELGERKFGKLQNLRFESGPVASASIGQVYRGFIDDREVAVKVQRPNVLAEIALDLFIVRELAPLYQKITRSATDYQTLANEWGRGFIAELNYQTEAANTMRFNKEMEKRAMTAVTAPVVLSEYSTERILVTEWVQGKRLDMSEADDVPRLCSVALNAYLVMLLEMQSLHCDPHPGNLLRTDDGRLCILDFGMTLETDPTLQYSLLEFVAHLTGEDYNRVPEDLVKLGFLKADRLDFVLRSGFLEPLTYFLKQAGEGGGADKVRERIFADFRARYPGLSDNELRTQMQSDMKKQVEEVRRRESAVTGVTVQVEELQRKNRDAFTIPSWFVYTSRAFLTLEGVSLQANENYSIIKSCFPYVAKRLLRDDSPRAQQALRDLLYGAGNYLDAERLTDLADGFATYTTNTKTIEKTTKDALVAAANKGSNGESRVGAVTLHNENAVDKKTSLAEAEAAITLAKDSADIILAPEGNLVQNLLVEESVLAASAQFKDALRGTLVEGPENFRKALPLGIGNVLPRLPLENSVKPFLRKTESEEKAQKLIGKISTMLPQPPSPQFPVARNEDVTPSMESLSRQLDQLLKVDPEQAALVAKELRENFPKYAPLLQRLGGKFASTLLKKASTNIETTLSSEEELNDELLKVTAKGLSSLATRGADAITSENND